MCGRSSPRRGRQWRIVLAWRSRPRSSLSGARGGTWPVPDYFAPESSYIDAGATVGAGTKIWHFSHVVPGAVIGERCNLGQNVVVMGGTRVGNNVKIQNNVSIY